MSDKPNLLTYINLAFMLLASVFLCFYLVIRFNGRLGSKISIISAAYGSNCMALKNNIKSDVSKWCNGKFYCGYKPTHEDPAVGCSKNYSVNWTCSRDRTVYPVYVLTYKETPSVIELKCPIR